MSNIFRDKAINKKEIRLLVQTAFVEYGVTRTAYLLDKLKELGFRYATDSGISIGPEDLRVTPVKKNLLRSGNWLVNTLELKYQIGQISKIERFQGVLEIWLEVSERLKLQAISYFKKADPLNSIYMMSFSGARGNLTQVHQLLGMRGMMANPSGELIEVPIKNNFKEGLTVTDYIISSYGARKGVVDTALRTADAGYLTRRLVDVAQDLVIRNIDCGTKNGILVSEVFNSDGLLIPFKERILGRVLAEDIYSSEGKILVKRGEVITQKIAQFFDSLNIKVVKIRSPLTCQLNSSICSKCYGWNLAYNRLVGLGEAVGVIAAQSIGEPGTQLTMRTFHTGGVFTGTTRQKIYAKFSGKVCFSSKLIAKDSRNSIGKTIWITQNSSHIKIRGFNNEQVHIKIKEGTLLEVNHGDLILKKAPLYEIKKSFEYANNQEANYQIFSDIDGEVRIDKNFKSSHSNSQISNLLVWVLSGQPFPVFKQARLLVKKAQNLRKSNYIASMSIHNEYEGNAYLYTDKINSKYTGIEMHIYPLIFDKANLKFTNDVDDELICIAQTYPTKKDKVRQKELIFESFQSPHFNQRIGEVINTSYKTPFGGLFFLLKDRQITRPDDKSITDTLTNIYYLPQETYTINLDIKDVHISSTKSIKRNTKLWKNGARAKKNGLCEIKLKQRKVKEITIKTGKVYYLNKSKIPFNYKKFNKFILFEGEKLFKRFVVKEPRLIEIYKDKKSNRFYLLSRPIICYNIPKDQSEARDFSTFTPDDDSVLFLRTNIKLPYAKKKFIKTSEKLNLKRSFLWLQSNEENVDSSKIAGTIIKRNKKNHFEISFLEKYPFQDLIEPNLINQPINLSTFFTNGQYVEPYTKLASINIEGQLSGKILDIKDHIYQNARQLLLIRQTDINKINIYENERNNLLVHKNSFVTIGTPLSQNIKANVSGKINDINELNLEIHKGKVYLFSSGACVYPSNGIFIKRGELLGLLKYQKARTNDIIQGLPRVESILEARMSRQVVPSNRQPGIVSNIEKQEDCYAITVTGIIDEIIEVNQEPVVKLGQFINAGAKLVAQPFNVHALLENHFDYFRRYVNLEEATYQSFAKVQLFLLSNVQTVYRSQGVGISDKHVEVIIRKMTAKVQVVDGGLSKLLPDDLINFTMLQVMNKSLIELSFPPILYRPALLGISKACLKGESFLASASFQETRRILTEAAIEGKIDWLFGIKESIIAGKMIPAGTGFEPYVKDIDLSYCENDC